MNPISSWNRKAPRFVILDDDPAALAYSRFRVLERYSAARIESSIEPKHGRAFDVAIVDNDFNGIACAVRLVRELRAAAPEGLLLVHSATLDRATLKELVGAGADGAFDKSNPADIDTAFEMIDRHLDGPPSRRNARTSQSVLAAISELLREWNSRLDSEEARLR